MYVITPRKYAVSALQQITPLCLEIHTQENSVIMETMPWNLNITESNKNGMTDLSIINVILLSDFTQASDIQLNKFVMSYIGQYPYSKVHGSKFLKVYL